MITEKIRALVQYRFEQAEEAYAAAQLLFQKGLLRRSVNNFYYAMFYTVLALLSIEKKETTKHSGAISLFDREFVKTKIFSKDFSRWLHEAFDLRQRCDYEPEFIISSEDARKTLDAAEAFLTEVLKCCAKFFATFVKPYQIRH